LCAGAENSVGRQNIKPNKCKRLKLEVKMQNNNIKYITVAASLMLFSCSKMTHDDYLAQAEAKAQSGNYSEAILAYKNAIAEAPQNIKTRIELGRAYLKVDLYGPADKELSKAISLGANDVSVYADLMKAQYLQNKHEDVVLLASDVEPKILQSAPELRVYEALALMELGDYSGAVKIRNLLELSDEKTFISAYIHANQGRFENAEKSLKKLSDSYENEELSMLRAKLAFLRGDNESAVASFQEYLEKRPNNFRGRVYLANTYIVQKNTAAANAAIADAEKLVSNHPLISQLKAEVEILNENFEEAKVHAENAIAKGLASNKVQASLAISSFKVGAYETSYAALEKIPELVNSNKGFKKLALLLRIELGYPIELTESRIKEFDADFSELVSFDLLKRGYFDEASALASSALVKYGQKGALNQSEKYKQATLQLAFGERESGLANLERVIAEDEDSNLASLLLAMNYFSNEEYSEAIDETRKGITKDPSFIPFYSVALQSHLRMNNTDEAEQTAGHLRKLAPDHETIAFYDVVQELKRDDFNAAKAVLDKFLSKYRATDKLKTLLFSINEETGNYEDNITFFSTNTNDGSDLLNERLLLLAYLNSDQTGKTEALLAEYGKKKKDSFYFDILAKLQLSKNELSDAAATYHTWSQSAFRSEASFIKLINVLDLMGDESEAFKESYRAVKLYPTSEALTLLYAHFSYRTDDVKSLERGVNLLRNANPSNEELPKLGGILLAMQGKLWEGVNLLEQYYLSNPNAKSFSEILSLIIDKAGVAASLRYLDKSVSSYPSDMIMLQYYADAYLPRDSEKSIAAYSQIVESAPNNVNALNNLAWLLNEAGKTNDAMMTIEKAYALSNDNVPVISTYASVLFSNGEYSRVVALLSDIVRNKKSLSSMSFLNYAEALIETGDKKEAKRVLEGVDVSGDKLKARKQGLLKRLK
jgi:putative PEP-CTERM system TPR-repeat lipoprotein